MPTLLTFNDVRDATEVSKRLSAEKVQTQIEPIEQYLFDKVLGFDFYTALLADAVDYSAVTTWAAGSYTAGNLVYWKGVVFVADIDTSAEPPAYGWSIAPKFTTACNNQLWPYLRRYLALCIIKRSISYLAYQVADGGINRGTGNNYIPADFRDVERLAKSIDTDVEVAFWNMHRFATKGGCTFPLYQYATVSTQLTVCISDDHSIIVTLSPATSPIRKRPRIVVG